jgi:hypothetical protein
MLLRHLRVRAPALLIVVLVVLASARVLAAEPPPDPADAADDDGVGVGWKIGIACAITGIALSGVVAAVTRDPIEHDVRKLSPALAASLTPRVVVFTTAAVSAVAAVSVVAVAIEEHPAVR